MRSPRYTALSRRSRIAVGHRLHSDNVLKRAKLFRNDAIRPVIFGDGLGCIDDLNRVIFTAG